MPVYEVKPESVNGSTRVLHQNLLLPRSFLPVETHLKSPKSSHTLSRRTHRQQTSKEETTGTIDEDIPGLTPDQLQEFYESTGHTEDSCGTVPELVEQDNYPCQDDRPESEGEAEDPVQPGGAMANEAAHGVPLRQSQRVSKPLLWMTYDVIGQPSFRPSSTAGIQGVTVSYPQQLLQPVTVPWIQQPVVQPYSYFVPFPVPVQPMYPAPMWCY